MTDLYKAEMPFKRVMDRVIRNNNLNKDEVSIQWEDIGTDDTEEIDDHGILLAYYPGDWDEHFEGKPSLIQDESAPNTIKLAGEREKYSRSEFKDWVRSTIKDQYGVDVTLSKRSTNVYTIKKS